MIDTAQPADPSEDGTQRLLTWDQVSSALNVLIERSAHTIDIVDHNLAMQDWGSRARCDALQQAAAGLTLLLPCPTPPFLGADRRQRAQGRDLTPAAGGDPTLSL